MRVAWADTDASGRIHFTAAFRWAEVAEHAMLRDLGLADVGEFPRRHVEAAFHRPLRFPDEFDLVLAPERLGRTSAAYIWRAERDSEPYIEGRTTVVLLDATGTPLPLPDAFRNALS
jgi:acyl-CoA thioesterase FadM